MCKKNVLLGSISELFGCEALQSVFEFHIVVRPSLVEYGCSDLEFVNVPFRAKLVGRARLNSHQPSLDKVVYDQVNIVVNVAFSSQNIHGIGVHGKHVRKSFGDLVVNAITHFFKRKNVWVCEHGPYPCQNNGIKLAERIWQRRIGHLEVFECLSVCVVFEVCLSGVVCVWSGVVCVWSVCCVCVGKRYFHTDCTVMVFVVHFPYFPRLATRANTAITSTNSKSKMANPTPNNTGHGQEVICWFPFPFPVPFPFPAPVL